jgi:hypothetical protein
MTILATLIATAVPLHTDCPKTFTYHMDTRAAWAVYAGTHDVPQHDISMLRRIARCQRRHHNVHRAKIFNAARRADWVERRLDRNMSSALASYYTDHGTGACGVGDVQSGYRFASLFLRCGTVVRFCFNGCVDAIMSDHGPYVAGRTFDLNANLKYGIGCSDLCSVRWRIAAG